MKTTVIIQNLKCDDCKQKVITAVNKFSRISILDIDITIGSISFDYKSHNAIEGLRYYLSTIGFPITEDPDIIKKDLDQNLITDF